MDFWQQYRAIDARDVRFDGQFVTAVSSTGIYCRPSCPARTPKPSNVTFFRTSAAAHDAGYRACRRCLPEAVPGDPEWNLRSDAAARAMRLITDGEVDRAGVPGLAARLGYSPRHLNRILKDELGAGALALARAHRAQTARTLLTASPLRFADVAFAAGFGSIRQFNETVQQVYGLTPGQLREASRYRGDAGGGPEKDGGAVRIPLSLPVRLPYDNGIFGLLAAHGVDRVESGTAAGHERLLRLPGGPAWFRAGVVEEQGNGQGAMPVTVSVAALSDLPSLLGRIRRLFDLDADPIAVDAGLSHDPSFAGLVAAAPGMRLPGSLDPHETLFRALAGQYLPSASTAATESLGRLAVSLSPADVAGTALTGFFPSAEDLADAPEPLLGGAGRRNDALRTAARRIAEGTLDLGVGSDPGEVRAALLDLDGVGQWTADYVIMRVLGHPDIDLSTDPAVLKGWSGVATRAAPGPTAPAGTPGPTASDAAALAAVMESIRPWRSYATLHLWRHALAHPSCGTPRSTLRRHPDAPPRRTLNPPTERTDVP